MAVNENELTGRFEDVVARASGLVGGAAALSLHIERPPVSEHAKIERKESGVATPPISRLRLSTAGASEATPEGQSRSA